MSTEKEQTLKTVTAQVISLTTSHFNPATEVIKTSTNFVADLNADSLDLAELTMAFEDAFGIVFDDSIKVNTVDDVIKYIATSLGIRSDSTSLASDTVTTSASATDQDLNSFNQSPS